MFWSWHKTMTKTRRGALVGALALVLAGPALAWADAKADALQDYQQTWGRRELLAERGTPANRLRFVSSIWSAARVEAGRLSGAVTEAEGMISFDIRPEVISKRSTDDRQMLMLLCQKTFDFGSRQRETYTTAAAALDLMQQCDPSRQLECAVALERLYVQATKILTNPKPELLLRLAETRFAVAQFRMERINALTSSSANVPGTPAATTGPGATEPASPPAGGAAMLTPEERLRALQDTNGNLAAALSSLTDAQRIARKPDRAPADVAAFEADARALRLGIAQLQIQVSAAVDRPRLERARLSLEQRLAEEPKDQLTADKLVQLFLNELPDPAGLAKVLPQASEKTRQAVALIDTPVATLAAADALMLGRYLEKIDDSPTSPAHGALTQHARACYNRYLSQAPDQDTQRPVAVAAAKRLETELDRLGLLTAETATSKPAGDTAVAGAPGTPAACDTQPGATASGATPPNATASTTTPPTAVEPVVVEPLPASLADDTSPKPKPPATPNPGTVASGHPTTPAAKPPKPTDPTPDAPAVPSGPRKSIFEFGREGFE
jgi:hypothetical protein